MIIQILMGRKEYHEFSATSGEDAYCPSFSCRVSPFDAGKITAPIQFGIGEYLLTGSRRFLIRCNNHNVSKACVLFSLLLDMSCTLDIGQLSASICKGHPIAGCHYAVQRLVSKL